MQNYPIIVNRPSRRRRARELRKSLTPAEARLWLRLKRLRADGYHFRRQAPFESYFLDFVCFSRKLVIEVDGSQHAEEQQEIHDFIRTKQLEKSGFRVLRFWNSQVLRDVERVMDTILDALDQTAPPCSPPASCPSP